jgi:stearoyl-CoA desaturase (Delta-9 desaturase)
MAGSELRVSPARRALHIVNLTLPLVAIGAAIALAWDAFVGWRDLAILAGMYVATGLGITVGFHRLLTHRSFATSRPIEVALAALGTMTLQGSVIEWVADHRKHHAHADREGDPHSPHVGRGSRLAGLWHAHAGWLFRHHGLADRRRYAADLVEDPAIRAVDRLFPVLVIASFAIPFALGYALGGTVEAALTALLWGGLVRIFLFHHATFAVNSAAHYFGSRPYETGDHSTNNGLVALLTFGEGWHNNHHAFPRSAAHGLRWWQVDVSALLIRGLERFGLAWNVVRIPPERLSVSRTARAFAGSPAPSPRARDPR